MNFSSKSREVRAWYDNYFLARGVYPNSFKVNRKLLSLLPIKTQRGRLLDIACGGGFLLKEVGQHCQSYGIDFSLAALRQAQKNSLNSEFCCSVAEELPFKSKVFDFLTCIGSLEHFIDMGKALEEIKRVSTSSAYTIILVPNQRDLLQLINQLFRGVFRDRQIIQRSFSHKEWERVLSRFFKIESILFINRDVDINMIRKGLEARGRRGLSLVVIPLFILLKLVELITPKSLCWSFVFVCRPK